MCSADTGGVVACGEKCRISNGCGERHHAGRGTAHTVRVTGESHKVGPSAAEVY